MIAVALDGFLRSDKGIPIDYAIKMFDAMASEFPIAVLADGEVVVTKQWMSLRGLHAYVTILGREVPVRGGETLRQAQIQYLRTLGPVSLVIDPDPATVAWLLSTGTPALLHAHPKYSRPEFRPDAPGIRTWATIMEELDRQAEMLTSDDRLREDRFNGRFE